MHHQRASLRVLNKNAYRPQMGVKKFWLRISCTPKPLSQNSERIRLVLCHHNFIFSQRSPSCSQKDRPHHPKGIKWKF